MITALPTTYTCDIEIFMPMGNATKEAASQRIDSLPGTESVFPKLCIFQIGVDLL